MAEKYFAGYSENSSVIGDDVSLISDGILSKILIDSDDKKSIGRIRRWDHWLLL